MTDRINHDKSWVMGVLEPILRKEIIVTKPGTDFMVAYRNSADSPTLKLTRSWVGPSSAPMLLRQRSARRAN
jgi:hypothetical protein